MSEQRLPSWLEEHLAEDVEFLARHVRTAAVTKVRAALVDDYAAALLAALMNPPAPPRDSRPERARPRIRPEAPAPQPPPPTDHSPAAAAPTDAVWMYAVVPAAADAGGVGQPGVRADAPVRLVTAGDVAVLVSDVNTSEVGALAESTGAGPDAALIDAVRAHDGVIDTAFRSGPVVPLRFATVVADDGAVAAVLGAHGATLAEELSRLDSAREWGVTVSELPAARRPVQPDRPTAPAATTGAGYLRQLSSDRTAQARARQDRADAVARIADQLAALAEDAREGPVRQDDDGRQILLNLSFLVRGTSESAFLRRCDELARSLPDQGLRLDHSGPWPPYHFVSVELEVEGA